MSKFCDRRFPAPFAGVGRRTAPLIDVLIDALVEPQLGFA